MSTTQNPGSPPATNPLTERVTLVSVGEPKATESGNVFVEAYFKRGVLGKAVRRSFFGRPGDDGQVVWERATPEELKGLVGADVTGQVFVEAVDHEPKEITFPATGEVRTITTTSIVRFSDETREQTCRRYGLVVKVTPAAPMATPFAPPGFAVVATNGNG